MNKKHPERTQKVTLYFTPREYEQLKEAAQRQGLEVPTLVRIMALRTPKQ